MLKVERKMCQDCTDKDKGICDRCIVGIVYDAEDYRLRKILSKESYARHRLITDRKIKR